MVKLQNHQEKKGDKLVGDYYVRFDKEYKKQINELLDKGADMDSAKNNAPLIKEAQEMLRKWEAGDEDVTALWKKMNEWVYSGFDITYKAMGVDFDKIYYESNTYKLGKKHILEGLEKGILVQDEDKSIWADLTEDGLDRKILLRSDGTSVYMTQDIGTALERYDEMKFNKHVYVVGNEQNYHFQVLSLILQKLGFDWAKQIYHLSYGMVELPEGKMKSREGTVVDADELMQDMIATAEEMGREMGKLDGVSEEDKKEIYRKIGMAALKYFILKVDPKKTMMFNPKESVDFNGNTGPFIQYTYARICSIMRKAEDLKLEIPTAISLDYKMSEKESQLLKTTLRFSEVVEEAGKNMSPALIANYVYDLVKEYNQFYHEHQILSDEVEQIEKVSRILLSRKVKEVIASGMDLLGIEMVERM